MPNNIIAGLDVGSRFVRMAAGEIVPAGDKDKIHLLGAVEVPSEGMRGGIVSNIEDVVSSISVCKERLERLIGMPIESVYASLNTSQVLCQESKGLASISRSSGEIEQEDVDRAIEQAQTIAIPSNYEILHILPKGYSVDSQSVVKDPVGMTGIRLEADVILVQIPVNYSRNLKKCIHRTTLEIDDIVFGIFADSEMVTNHRQKDVGVAVINIGASTTSLAVYEEGDLLHLAVLPIGADYITHDINLCFKLSSLDIAEKLKIKYGCANSKIVSKKDEIDLTSNGFDEDAVISRKDLSEIIEARVEEIFSKVNVELDKIGRAGILPAGVILCGGGAKLEGAVDIAKRELRLPTVIGCPQDDISSVSDKINDPSFITAISLIKWGSESFEEAGGGMDDFMGRIKNISSKGIGLIKDNFKTIWK